MQCKNVFFFELGLKIVNFGIDGVDYKFFSLPSGVNNNRQTLLLSLLRNAKDTQQNTK